MIQVDNNNNILNVVLERNSVNSINIDMLNKIIEVIKSINYKQVRIVVFSSSMKHFCAGADLKDRSGMSINETINFLDRINDLCFMISDIKVPTVSSVDGACLGGGLELALSCDFIVSSSKGIFGFPETSLGIIPGAGGTQRMTRKVGPSVSMKWIFTAERYSAEQSFQDGVVDFLTKVHQKDLENFIDKILQNSPIGIRMSKTAIKQSFIDHGFKKEREAYLKSLHSKDRDEGLNSFKEKRPPNWKNK